MLKEGQEFNFTIKRGVSTEDTVSVNYDDFINDVEAGDILLVDGELNSCHPTLNVRRLFVTCGSKFLFMLGHLICIQVIPTIMFSCAI